MKKLIPLLLFSFMCFSYESKSQQVLFTETGTVEQLNSGQYSFFPIAHFDSTGIVLHVDTVFLNGTYFIPQDIMNFKTAYSWGNPSGQYLPTSYVPAWQDITGKPTFAPVATSNDYNDLINKPANEIPSMSGQSGRFLTNNGLITSWSIIPTVSYTNTGGGAITVTKTAIATVTPSTGNGYSIDISGCGFTNVLGYVITPIKNTNLPTSVPKIAVKSVTSSAITVNIIEGNASLVSVLGFSVLSGVSEQFVNTTGLTLNVIVYGN